MSRNTLVKSLVGLGKSLVGPESEVCGRVGVVLSLFRDEVKTPDLTLKNSQYLLFLCCRS